jgi:glycosyltransferase involved in cell wall biosynthesis
MEDISVIIIHHEDENTLPRALASLAVQDVAHQVILVDDGSSSEVEHIVKRFRDLPIEVISTPRAVGRGASRQLALERVQTEWLTFLDADDWYLPEKLSRQLEIAQSHRSYELFSTDLFITTSQRQEPEVRGFKGAMGRLERQQVPFAPSLIRTSLAEEVGFDADYRIGEDRPFLDAVLARCEAMVIDEPLYAYEVNLLRRMGEEWELRRNHIKQAVRGGTRPSPPLFQVARELGAGIYNQLTRFAAPLLPPRSARGGRATEEQLQAYHSARSRLMQQLAERGFH